jgi:Domain of unknown function (DUF222)
MFEDGARLDAAATYPALLTAIEAIPTVAMRGGSAAASGARVRSLLEARRRLDARLLSEVEAFDAQGFGETFGFGSSQAFLRAYGKLDASQATRMVKAARVLRVLPLLAAELAAGRIGVEHVEAVAFGAARVPEEILATADQTLRDFSGSASPAELRRLAERLQDCHDQTAVAENAQHVHDSRHLSLSKTFGDAWRLEGLAEPEAGAKLPVALDSLITPHGPEDDRPAGARRADSLVELVDLGLRSGKLPDTGGDRPRLTYLVTAPAARTLELPDPDGSPEALENPPPMLGLRLLDQGDTVLLGSTAMLPAETIARIECDADTNSARLSEAGEILEFGLTRRFPSPAQRRALVVRDQGCVFPGCRLPPAYCQAHHLRFRSHLGPTNLNNLALVCSYHHHLVHEGGWSLAALWAGPGQLQRVWIATGSGGRRLSETRRPAT